MMRNYTPVLFVVALGIFGLRIMSAINLRPGSLYTIPSHKSFFVVVDRDGIPLFDEDIKKNIQSIRGSKTLQAVGLAKQVVVGATVRVFNDTSVAFYRKTSKNIPYFILRNCPVSTPKAIKVGNIRCYIVDPMAS
ncbi:MAG: hypothetical protein WC365_00115 [Candidatus Babeliales bacterium]|jgi:hypothetical protein